MQRFHVVVIFLVSLLCSCGEKPAPAHSGESAGGAGGTLVNPIPASEWKKRAAFSRSRGIEALLSLAKDGKWAFAPERGPDVGITAICATAVLDSKDEKARAAMQGTLDWILSLQKKDGSIHQGQVASYCTAASVLAFKADGDPRFAEAIRRATSYLASVQLDEEEGITRKSKFYGGFGYKRGNPNPNLSSTQWALDAAEGGVPKDSGFYRKALVFLERVQNRSESNDWKGEAGGRRIEPGNDGGAYYQPWASKAGVRELPGGAAAFRSYGSMSYALLKCYLLCDLDVKNPRVQAVVDWMSKNWDLTKNPGLEHLDEPAADQMGLYYYYFTIARTLGIAESKGMTLGGTLAKWRQDLCAALVERQRENGVWVNDQTRWYEGNPALVTAYALMALNECLE